MRHVPIRRRGAAKEMLAVVAVSLALASCAGAAPAASKPAMSSTPAPSAATATPTPGEATLLDGMRLDLKGACQPLRSGLPSNAIAGLDCDPSDPDVAGLQVFLFNRDDNLMSAYLAIVSAQGITLRTNLDSLAISEGSYQPGDDPAGPMADTRHAHWLDDSGHARYIATEPPFVLLSAIGTNRFVDNLYHWAWRGMQDVPGAPNLWIEGHPADPNAKK
jgi:hypothetical protein